MEVVDEVAMMGANDPIQIVKGKRTKRQRPSSPLSAVDMPTSNSSSGDGDGGSGGGDIQSYQTPTTSVDLGETTEEEEDMANCLILLAQGNSLDSLKQIDDDGDAIMEKFISRRCNDVPLPTTTNKAGGFYLYQCKTCNRCFNSFQALGGHRASHKKPKAVVAEKRTLMLLEDNHNYSQLINSPSLNLQMSNNRASSHTTTTANKPKVHGCSICGSEFSSGQALGGHMRRHRSSTTTTNTTSIPMDTIVTQPTAKKPRNFLSLDLNLPAPEEDRDSKFPFASKQQPLVFSTSSLVDCHY